MDKVEKELIDKAAVRYGKRMEGRTSTFAQAFKDGILWYKKNKEKIGEVVAMEEGYKILMER